MNMTERNDGKMTYDSAQFVANKRWAKGVTLNATYTYVPRWTETAEHDNGGQAFIDDCRMLPNDGPYFSHRKHRMTASGVWEMPWCATAPTGRPALLGGWSIAPMFIYQSGSRGTCRATSSCVGRSRRASR